MATKKFTELAVATVPFVGTEDVALIQGGVSSQANLKDVRGVGAVIHSTFGSYATSADLTTQIPLDDTIPQNTEGTEIISMSHTPKSTTNKLRITFQGAGACSGSAHFAAALFRDAIADAIAASFATTHAANVLETIGFQHEYTPGVLTAQTLAIRVGPMAAVTLRMNGISTGRRLGGVMACSLLVEEIQV